MEKEELIDKFLSNQLSQEERSAFEEALKKDKDLRQEVDFRRDLSAVVFEKEEKNLRSRLKDVDLKLASDRKRLIRRLVFILIGLLFLAAAIIGYKLELRQKSPQAIYAEYYEAYPNVHHPVTRGKNDPLTRAFMAYEGGDHAAAIDLFEKQIVGASTRQIPLKFYQAISYAETGNLKMAINRLENIRRFETPYLAESYWYLGLFYAQQGNKTAAIPRFQNYYELSNDPLRKQQTVNIINRLQGKEQ